MSGAALVTGGSSGIGLAIARALREDGYELTLASRTREKVEAAAAELDALGRHRPMSPRRTTAAASSTSTNGATAAWTCSSTPPASASPARSTSCPTKHVDLQLDVNLRGLMLVTAAALPLLRDAHGLDRQPRVDRGNDGHAVSAGLRSDEGGGDPVHDTLNHGEQDHGVRATAISPGFVDTPMTDWSPVPKEEMIRPEDCAEIVRLLLRLSPHARVPHVVVERVGS